MKSIILQYDKEQNIFIYFMLFMENLNFKIFFDGRSHLPQIYELLRDDLPGSLDKQMPWQSTQVHQGQGSLDKQMPSQSTQVYKGKGNTQLHQGQGSLDKQMCFQQKNSAS